MKEVCVTDATYAPVDSSGVSYSFTSYVFVKMDDLTRFFFKCLDLCLSTFCCSS